mmetsp:Transcript_7794/g.20735  ORF Transcript_7794/g.20735 Transcript_7794/m.20735 type:complete len:290 (+) Transcript_7794:128-997(+)
MSKHAPCSKHSLSLAITQEKCHLSNSLSEMNLTKLLQTFVKAGSHQSRPSSRQASVALKHIIACTYDMYCIQDLANQESPARLGCGPQCSCLDAYSNLFEGSLTYPEESTHADVLAHLVPPQRLALHRVLALPCQPPRPLQHVQLSTTTPSAITASNSLSAISWITRDCKKAHSLVSCCSGYRAGYRLTQAKPLRAFSLPGFLRSTDRLSHRASFRSQPRDRASLAGCMELRTKSRSARAMPVRAAWACDEMPPPRTTTSTENRRRVSGAMSMGANNNCRSSGPLKYWS